MTPLFRPAALAALSVSFLFALPGAALAQDAPGSITGRVTDGTSKPVAGAAVQLVGTPYWARTHDDGSFRLENVAPGSHLLRARLLGFSADSARVTVASGSAVEATIALHPVPVNLQSVLVVAHRLGETKAAALDRQQLADNLVTVLSGDEIRALPNGNAAEAAGRMPDVSLERDEGEGKFVQVRGTEPRLSNVTVDGVHVPGTEQGNRIVKLDDVPSDVLAAIEVSKTLTADMDADAIGGSVNLVTKTPEGLPQGYVAVQYGRTSLLSRDVTQGGLTYGGRFGPDAKLGFLIGGSVDRNNRAINDVEPSWTVDSLNRSIPVEWSQRDYTYYRTRYGVGMDLDYRFSDHSTLYLKGLWSLFKNHGTRYVYDIATGGDSAGVGTSGYGTDAALTREVQHRTPTEQLWGLTAGGRHERGFWSFDYAANYSGTRQSVVDYRSSGFVYAPTGTGNTLTFKYDASNSEMPMYQYVNAAEALAASTPANFVLGGYDANNGLTTGRDIGGQFSAQRAYELGNSPSAFKIGLRLRDEAKDYTRANVSFDPTQSYTLAQALGSFSDPSYYSDLSSGFSIGPQADLGITNQWEDSHPAAFTANQSQDQRNALASFRGSERIYAGYVMNTVDFGQLHVNVGVRFEATHSDYTGHAAAHDSATNTTTISEVSGTQNYTDVFPSAQLRYAVDQNTNVRIAVTRGIARPNYSDLAPSLQGSVNAIYKLQYSNLSAGNPNLRPQRAWNYDLLIERFLPSVGGVLSGGVFYKSLSDVILTRNFIYQGPYQPFQGYYGTEPENGGSGHLTGVEADWVQHFTFLPGVWAGLGLDVNWTHVDSKVLVDPASGREAPLLRQAPSIANAALLYDQGPVSARVAWTYNGAYIGAYGDGTATANGDNYFYQHSQIDGSVIYNVTPGVQLQLQALNLNNAQFGFFQGTPDQRFNVQREYYGRTFYLGAKYGF
jgi:TonB-dependent receptor